MSGKGRPRWKPSAKIRRQVEEWLSVGMTVEEIGRVLKKDSATIHKNFPNEIQYGRQKRRAEVVSMAFQGARKGNATLIKYLDNLTGAASAHDGFMAPFDEAKPVKETKLGKKEVAAAAAETAGTETEWGADLVPAVVPPRHQQN